MSYKESCNGRDLRVLVLIGLIGVLSAQTASVVEPSYPNEFYALSADGHLVELEHETLADIHTKARVLPGYASAKTMAEIKQVTPQSGSTPNRS